MNDEFYSLHMILTRVLDSYMKRASRVGLIEIMDDLSNENNQ